MRKLLAFALLGLAACEVGPDYVAPTVDLPGHWGSPSIEAAGEATIIPRDWWKLFNDPTLVALEDEGLKANSDLLIAAARVAEARAELHLATADLYPEVDVQGGATRTKISQESAQGSFSQLAGKPYNDFSVAAVLNYEVDLWGKLRRAKEAARAQLLSVQANRDAIRIAVASDIASGYFNLLALDAQVAVTNQTIQSRSESFTYENKQYKAGAINALEWRQSEAELASAQAELPVLIQARMEQQNALAILLGRTPKELLEKPITRGKELSSIPVPPNMPVDLPSTLLQRRPDIASAEQSLVAANAQIGVATADYFPTISLSALIGLDAGQTNHLLQGSAKNWAVGANFMGPLLDFGRTTANVDVAKAQTSETLASYQQTVRSAFAETLNSMNRVETADERVKAETAQVMSRAEANRVAAKRFDAGYTNQLEFLDTERNLYVAQLDAITAMRDRLTAAVTLYKALGGGWAPHGTMPAMEKPKP